MTADQAKEAVTNAVLQGVTNITSKLCDGIIGGAEQGKDAVERFAAGVNHLRQVEATAHRLIEKAFSGS